MEFRLVSLVALCRAHVNGLVNGFPQSGVKVLRITHKPTVDYPKVTGCIWEFGKSYLSWGFENLRKLTGVGRVARMSYKSNLVPLALMSRDICGVYMLSWNLH